MRISNEIANRGQDYYIENRVRYIASKTISRQLIEDGIIGKPLLRKPRKQGYDLVRIVNKRGYYMNTNRQQVDELAGEPLWVPSFIDSKQWQRSVGQFTTLSPLDSNVEKFLLPYMDDYLQSLTEEELVAMGDRRKFCVIDVPRQYENLRLSQE